MGPQPPQFEFCFWKDDYVSNKAMQDFLFEASDWQWVMRVFQDHNLVRRASKSCEYFQEVPRKSPGRPQEVLSQRVSTGLFSKNIKT